MLAGYCLKGDTLKKAVLVKRARLSTAGLLTGVLRMEFSDLSLRGFEWADGDAVRETLKFQFKKLTLKYVKRKPDGSTASQWSADWEWKES